MLWKPRHFFPVIHSVRCVRVEIRTVASPRRFHFTVPGWILVFVVDAKEERILRVHRAVGKSIDADDHFIVAVFRRRHRRYYYWCFGRRSRKGFSANEEGERARPRREHLRCDEILFVKLRST